MNGNVPCVLQQDRRECWTAENVTVGAGYSPTPPRMWQPRWRLRETPGSGTAGHAQQLGNMASTTAAGVMGMEITNEDLRHQRRKKSQLGSRAGT